MGRVPEMVSPAHLRSLANIELRRRVTLGKSGDAMYTCFRKDSLTADPVVKVIFAARSDGYAHGVAPVQPPTRQKNINIKQGTVFFFFFHLTDLTDW